MAISFIAVSISDVLTKNVGIKPIGTAEDDYMLAHVWAYEETVTSVPTGWTGPENVFTGPTIDVDGQLEAFNHYIYGKFAGASEPATYTWGTTTDTGPDPNRRVVIVTYRGVQPDVGAFHPIAGVSDGHTEKGGVGHANPNTLEIFGLSGAPVTQRVVIMAAVGTTSPTATMDSPWVQRLDDDGCFVFDYQVVSGGVITNPVVMEFPAAMTSWGHGIRLNAAPEPAGDRNYCQSVDTQIN